MLKLNAMISALKQKYTVLLTFFMFGTHNLGFAFDPTCIYICFHHKAVHKQALTINVTNYESIIFEPIMYQDNIQSEFS